MKRHSEPEGWNEIVGRVLEAFDPKDLAHRWAIAEWQKHVEKERDGKPLGDVVHEFASDEVVAKAIEYFRADIQDYIAIFQAKACRNRLREAHAQVRSALGLHDGFFPDDDQVINIERLAVIQSGREEERAICQRLVEVSRALASGEHEPTERVARDGLPAAFRENEGVKAFIAELREFLGANDEQGRDLVRRVCDDQDLAQRVKDDAGMPELVRFLADLSLKAHDSGSRLPAERRPIGFAPAPGTRGRSAGSPSR